MEYTNKVFAALDVLHVIDVKIKQFKVATTLLRNT